MLPQIILEGRAVDDPELRFTPGGKAVANVRVVASERRKTDNGGWEDGDRSPFLTVTLWDQAAEALAEQVRKGDKVLVTGKLFEREYEKRDGGKGSSIEVKHGTVALVPGGRKAERENTRNGNQPASRQADDPWASQPSSDPWASQPASDQPPF